MDDDDFLLLGGPDPVISPTPATATRPGLASMTTNTVSSTATLGSKAVPPPHQRPGAQSSSSAAVIRHKTNANLMVDKDEDSEYLAPAAPEEDSQDVGGYDFTGGSAELAATTHVTIGALAQKQQQKSIAAKTTATKQKKGQAKKVVQSSASQQPAGKPRQPQQQQHPALQPSLYPYQVQGVQFLRHHHFNSAGCLLADEMGLGKTVQVVAFLTALMREGLIRTSVVVVPPTLVPVWTTALETFGQLQVDHNIISVIGTKAQRDKQWRAVLCLAHTPCVVLTTYGVLKQDTAMFTTTAHPIDYLVLDEAQAIKDPSTQAHKTAITVGAKVKHRIAVTGTPVMNDFTDLWALMNYIDPNVIGMSRAEFRSVNTTIKRGNERDAGSTERSGAEAKVLQLTERVSSFVLRREKKDIHEGLFSSKKTDVVLWLTPTAVQAKQYDAFLNSDVVQESLRHQDVQQPLVLLTALKKLCDHPWLNLNGGNYRKALDAVVQRCEGEEEKDGQMSPESAGSHPAGLGFVHQSLIDFGSLTDSCKMNATMSLVRHHIKEKKKTLIFSQSKRMLDMVSMLLHYGLRANLIRIDGDTPPADRAKLVADFNGGNLEEHPEAPQVCLLTTQVGGVGLTLTGASRVIIVDPHWNPAVDAQAVDRVHRIGQTEDVVVYRLITAGTVEEKVYRNQVFKMMAFEQVKRGCLAAAAKQNPNGVALGPRPTSGPESHREEMLLRYFTQVQLRSMFDLGDTEYSETAAQLHDVHGTTLPEELTMVLTVDVQAACGYSDHSVIFTAAADGKVDLMDPTTTSNTQPAAGRRRKVAPRRRVAPRPNVARMKKGLVATDTTTTTMADSSTATSSQHTDAASSTANGGGAELLVELSDLLSSSDLSFRHSSDSQQQHGVAATSRLPTVRVESSQQQQRYHHSASAEERHQDADGRPSHRVTGRLSVARWSMFEQPVDEECDDRLKSGMVDDGEDPQVQSIDLHSNHHPDTDDDASFAKVELVTIQGGLQIPSLDMGLVKRNTCLADFPDQHLEDDDDGQYSIVTNSDIGELAYVYDEGLDQELAERRRAEVMSEWEHPSLDFYEGQNTYGCEGGAEYDDEDGTAAATSCGDFFPQPRSAMKLPPRMSNSDVDHQEGSGQRLSFSYDVPM